MSSDYRNTEYCPNLSEIKSKKNALVKKIKQDHPRAVDMHNFVSDNNAVYKEQFMNAYNNKCAYCGVSISVIPIQMFEIDHFIYQKNFKTKKEAGYIENLVLSCYTCNRGKSSLSIPTSAFNDLHPDEEGIAKTFVRDKDFYIQISADKENDPTVQDFYNELKLWSELHRIDYMLMSMIGMQKVLTGNDKALAKLGQAITTLQSKRNRTFI